jgi:sterol desaturase/sphingolipid hydroxylase (fatty acid hydroxylase superfamily)
MDIISYQLAVRLGVFTAVFALMAAWEFLAPRRRLTTGQPVRRLSNLGLLLLDVLAMRLVLPMGAVGVAVVGEDHGWGLLNNLSLPGWLAVVLAVVALDFVIYLQHVLFHAVLVLWRLHRVHHADMDFDVTTGVRFHTFEILLSLGIKLAAIVLLGAPATAVLVLEVVLNASSLFNHGNVQLPRWLDRVLRLVIVTPDMHRVHHSTIPDETNSNFGFNLPWWDYLLGTYRSQPMQGHEGLSLGLSQFRDPRVEQLHWMLALPFIGRLGNYPVNRRGDERPNEDASAGAAHPKTVQRTPAGVP